MKTHYDEVAHTEQSSIANAVIQKKDDESSSEFVDNRPEMFHQQMVQEMADNSPQSKEAMQLQDLANQHSTQSPPETTKENKTGLPDDVKEGVENQSGYSMDDVDVYYDSDEPEKIGALAYAKGTDIHVKSGEEEHVPHEAWHVAQQKQGRVKPTIQMKGESTMNDDKSLEREADIMGDKALKTKGKQKNLQKKSVGAPLIQAKLTKGKLNVVGEMHKESEPRRKAERDMVKEKIGSKNYWLEDEFQTGKGKNKHIADPFELRFLQNLNILKDASEQFGTNLNPCFAHFKVMFKNLNKNKDGKELSKDRKKYYKELEKTINQWSEFAYDRSRVNTVVNEAFPDIQRNIAESEGFAVDEVEGRDNIGKARSIKMHEAANIEAANQVGVWKIGQQHIEDMEELGDKEYEVTPKDEFDAEIEEYRKGK